MWCLPEAGTANGPGKPRLRDGVFNLRGKQGGPGIQSLQGGFSVLDFLWIPVALLVTEKSFFLVTRHSLLDTVQP